MVHTGESVEDLGAELADFVKRVDVALDGFLTRQHHALTSIDPQLENAANALERFVRGGGKRLRPAFAYYGYRGAHGADDPHIIATVAALELLHAGALIHDDVMDASDTRRGGPAIHRAFATLHADARWIGASDAYGLAVAILLGDLCLVWADDLFAEDLTAEGLITQRDPVTVRRARAEFAAVRTEVMAGQLLDVTAQAAGADPTNTPQRASRIARYKSAKYTVERPLRLGAALAGAEAEVTEAYSAFGGPLGEAFQLRDDLLGVFGDPVRTGKPAGDDLREGKRTYLVNAAWQAADSAQRKQLDRLLGDPTLAELGVATIQQIISDTGARERTESRITDLTAEARYALDHAPIDAEAAAMLRYLAHAATARET